MKQCPLGRLALRMFQVAEHHGYCTTSGDKRSKLEHSIKDCIEQECGWWNEKYLCCSIAQNCDISNKDLREVQSKKNTT